MRCNLNRLYCDLQQYKFIHFSKYPAITIKTTTLHDVLNLIQDDIRFYSPIIGNLLPLPAISSTSLGSRYPGNRDCSSFINSIALALFTLK